MKYHPSTLTWYLGWHFGILLRSLCVRCFFFAHFRSVGSRVKFFGVPAFGTCNGNVLLGKSCLIGRQLFFSAHQSSQIIIGDGCSINTGCHLVSVFGIHIGEGTRIGEYCSIRDQNHNFSDSSISVANQGYTGAAIHIGKNCWIGRGVYIGPGVNIGDGAVVGANAVVVKNVNAFDIVAGVPAKKIGQRSQSVSS